MWCPSVLQHRATLCEHNSIFEFLAQRKELPAEPLDLTDYFIGNYKLEENTLRVKQNLCSFEWLITWVRKSRNRERFGVRSQIPGLILEKDCSWPSMQQSFLTPRAEIDSDSRRIANQKSWSLLDPPKSQYRSMRAIYFNSTILIVCTNWPARIVQKYIPLLRFPPSNFRLWTPTDS